jgi:16S rRNA (guanine966-N2)-methyltransferase
MRIVSGKHRGRNIPVRTNFPARPTTDFAKESLFNILNNWFDFEEIDVLDLFSGTGSISYEFASRGCKNIVSVENDFRSYSFIKKTAIDIKLEAVSAVKADVFSFIAKCKNSFDIVFADPPYQLDRIGELPDLILKSSVLKNEGMFILEHGKDQHFQENEYFQEKRVYGGVNFSFFKPK